MVRMVALRRWVGREGRVRPGDVIDVDENRARQLEGYVTRNGRIITPTEAATDMQREIQTEARAKRLNDADTNTKGGPTVGTRTGSNDREKTSGEPDATDGAEKLAAAHGATLRGITGTGKNGRIVRADVAAIYGEPPGNE